MNLKLIEFESKHPELQSLFLKKIKCFEDDELKCQQAELCLVSKEYWDFVEKCYNELVGGENN